MSTESTKTIAVVPAEPGWRAKSVTARELATMKFRQPRYRIEGLSAEAYAEASKAIEVIRRLINGKTSGPKTIDKLLALERALHMEHIRWEDQLSDKDFARHIAKSHEVANAAAE